jgi:hypothetical protein
MDIASLATLGLRLDATEMVTGAERARTALRGVDEQAAKTSRGAALLQRTVIQLGAAFSAYQAARWAAETVSLGARYQTLGVVMDVLGRNVGKTRTEMEVLQGSLQKTGISAIQARNNIARMIGANLDLANATQLARLAQDAAVIANLNSSQAFEQLIGGISTGQPRILRTMGIFVDFNRALDEHAKATGRTAEQLGEWEKTNIRANATMQAGAAIAGAYEASLETAGKQIRSAERYLEDARVAVSQAFQPAYTAAVFAYADALKAIGRNAETIQATLLVVGGLAAAGALYWIGYAKAVAAVTLAHTLLNASIAATVFRMGLMAAAVGTFAVAAAPVLVLAGAFALLVAAIKDARTEAALLDQEIADDAKLSRTMQAIRYRRTHGTEAAAQFYPELYGGGAGRDTGTAAATEDYQKLVAATRLLATEQLALNAAFGATDAELKRIQLDFELQRDLAEDRIRFTATEAAALAVLRQRLHEAKTAAIDLDAARERTQNINANILRQIEQETAEWVQLQLARRASGLAAADLEREVDILQREAEARRIGAEAVRALTVELAGEAAVRQLIAENPLATPEELARVRQLARMAAELRTELVPDWKGVFDGMQRALSDFYVQAEHDGAAAFARLFAEIGRLWAQQLVNLKVLSARDAGILGAGFSGLGVGASTGDIGMGVISGGLAGAPFGAAGIAVGALGGLAGGLSALGRSAEEARRRIATFERALTTAILDVFGTETQRAIQAIQNQAAELRDAARAAYDDPNIYKRAGDDEARATQEDALRRINELERERLLLLWAQARLADVQNRHDYQVRLLVAQGRDDEADALRLALDHSRESAEAKRNEASATTLAALAAAQAAEKQALLAAQQQAAADAARDLARAFQDLEVRRLRAVGFGEEADALAFALQQQREYEDAVRAGTDAVTLAKLAEVQRVEAIRWAAETQIALRQREADAAQQALDGLRRTIDTLEDFSRELRGQTGTPFQQIGTARAEFERVAALARAGDQAAAARLPELGRAFLEASRAYNASGLGFQQDAATVQRVIDEIATVFEGQATIEQQKLDAALAEIAIQQSILDQLRAEEEARREREEEEWRRRWEDKDRRRREEDTQHKETLDEQRKTNDRLQNSVEVLTDGFQALEAAVLSLGTTVDENTQITKRVLEGVTLP